MAMVITKSHCHHLHIPAAMKLKDACSLKKSYDKLRKHIKKQGHCFPRGLVLRIHLPMWGHRSDPCTGKIPQAAEQLSLCTTTTEV